MSRSTWARAIKRISIALLFAFGSVAHAGWQSGGGKYFSDANNPWFVENTEQISYCIKMDSRNFGQDVETVRQMVGRAFAYWTTQFNFINGNRVIKLGTQASRLVSCRERPDIVFQFGVLTGEQAKYLGDPRRIISSAVRTHYDPVNLKGRGFVYVSPIEGRFAPIGEGQSASWPMKLTADRWRVQGGQILELTLIHEIGHVFGLVHAGIGIMAENFVQHLVTSPGYSESKLTVGGFFVYDSPVDYSWESVLVKDDFAKYLGLSSRAASIRIVPDYNTLDGALLLAKEPNQTEYAQIGTLRRISTVGGSAAPIASVFLTRQQKVFSFEVPNCGKAFDVLAWNRADGAFDLHLNSKDSKVTLATTSDEMHFSFVDSNGIIQTKGASFSKFLTSQGKDGSPLTIDLGRKSRLRE